MTKRHERRDRLEALLQKHFGFERFRAGQKPLIQAVLRGRDALGVLPTGGGKSLCYQIPALVVPSLVLVVSPLISLMRDQVERAQTIGLRAASMTSVASASETRSTLRSIGAGCLDLLFCSPEKLDSERFRSLLARVGLSLVTVDEAHCISEWGHDFRPAFRTLARVRQLASAPVLALTATATPRVRSDIVATLALESPRIVVTSFDRPNIRWTVRTLAAGQERVRAMAAVMKEAVPPGRAALVYAPTRRTVVNVRRALASLGRVGDAYHAGLPPDERDRVQGRFLERTSNLVVATSAFGMGIDRSDVGLVVHYALPGSVESYYQEAGRAGRDGGPALALAFVHRKDWAIPSAFIDRSYPSRRSVMNLLRRLARTGSRGVPFGQLRGAGAADSPAPQVRWLLRLGAVAVTPDLAAWLNDWPNVEREPPAGRVRPLPHRAVNLDPLADARRAARARLTTIRRYSSGKGCRRMVLLRYLGEASDRRSCGSCDWCERRRGPAGRALPLQARHGCDAPISQ